MHGRFITTENASGKIQIAEQFSERLWNRHIEFIGISGSVSYTPEPTDDIDIFIITKTGWLWPELFWAFMLRRILRMNDICLSLSLDSRSAGILFRKLTMLQERDAMHVIPVKGKDFYLELLRERNVIGGKGKFPGELNKSAKAAQRTFMELVNIAFYLVLSPMQKIKELRFNSINIQTSPDKVYHIRMDPGRLILDSEKYRRLSRSVEGADE